MARGGAGEGRGGGGGAGGLRVQPQAALQAARDGQLAAGGDRQGARAEPAHQRRVRGDDRRHLPRDGLDALRQVPPRGGHLCRQPVVRAFDAVGRHRLPRARRRLDQAGGGPGGAAVRQAPKRNALGRRRGGDGAAGGRRTRCAPPAAARDGALRAAQQLGVPRLCDRHGARVQGARAAAAGRGEGTRAGPPRDRTVAAVRLA
mmetsp:Transcript_28049/g.67964  ORF Transcript_28049/g.67964 Transcript_28049/m.67964 type:complete len:203 (+) Transcript_28049:1163-1771(+)